MGSISNNTVSDKCSGLPDLPMIKTKTVFPVIVGTRVEISCIPGHQLSGSAVITCVKDKQFVIEQRPACQIGVIINKLQSRPIMET